ncbi:alpha/beta fold hydrolase [Streptomyces sp. NPDC047117]|uniref:thioesterase II family protein n=1 Tax=Streptomyces sp. NPDC047117 TaxID=3155379 RepID=UPI0033DE9ECD
MMWTQCIEPRPFATRRLVCFPHAGGSPYFFRTWGKALSGYEVHAVCYPGRAERIAEPPAADLASMAREIAAAMAPSAAERPTSFFGHSMGAIVAYEVACALEEAGHPIEHLFASAARAPQLLRATPDTAAAWDDEAIIGKLVELGGTDAELLHNPAFVDLVLPYIGADFRMLAGYESGRRAPLRCPVTALVGRADPQVGSDGVAAWRETTRGEFRMRTLPGDHFYLAAEPPFDIIEAAAGEQ